jgi:hypothetical protein
MYMTLRIHRVSASRWNQLAASRLPIDLTTTEEEPEPSPAAVDRVRAEHAEIQAQVDRIAAPGISAVR